MNRPHEPLSPGSTIGILGGGQLARMLALAAFRLDYKVAILEPQGDAPAAQIASVHYAAEYDDERNLEFLAGAHVVTTEFENVPAASARFLSEHARVAPNADVLAVAQDRLSEKRAIEKLGLRVAPHRAVDDAVDLSAARDALGSIVLKTRRLGYDGKGQRVIRDDDPAEDAEEARLALGGTDLIAEALLPLEAELSVIAVRGWDSHAITFDPARNEHEDGILRRSTVPSGLGHDLESEARSAGLRIVEAFDYVGAMGIEFFVVGGELIVNEIAPRVHNSGHWTEAACVIDQFEAHIRAVAGLPLGDGSRHSDAVMENLIGEEVARAATLAADPAVRVHLYGKREVRPGRKMGHATRIGPRSDGV